LRANRAFAGKELVMTPGDKRTFRKSNGNAVVLAVGLWAAHDGIHLRIDMTGTHKTLTNRPGSERNHRILFRDLRKVLMANGCWESGDEGAEGQATGSDED
jgi:hypothetical protein